MKRVIFALGFCAILSGCGMSQKDLRAVNDLLEKSKEADCQTIHNYLGLIQNEVQKKLK